MLERPEPERSNIHVSVNEAHASFLFPPQGSNNLYLGEKISSILSNQYEDQPRIKTGMNPHLTDATTTPHMLQSLSLSNETFQ